MKQLTKGNSIVKEYRIKGYETGPIYIEDFDITVNLDPLKTCVRYTESKSPKESLLEIMAGCLNLIPLGPECNGMMMESFFSDPSSDCTIYAYDIMNCTQVDYVNFIYNRAHEWGHFLYRLGYESLIYSKFKDPERIKSFIKNEEHFAQLAGNYKLFLEGYDLTKMIGVSLDSSINQIDAEVKKLILEQVKDSEDKEEIRRKENEAI